MGIMEKKMETFPISLPNSRRYNDPDFEGSYELWSKLQVSRLVSPAIVPNLIPCISGAGDESPGGAERYRILLGHAGTRDP